MDSHNGEVMKVKIINTPEKTDLLGKFQIEKTLDCVKKLISDLGADEPEFKVCFSTEMHGFIVADVEGRPFCDYISWKNECAREIFRGCSYLDYVKGLLREKEILNTGMIVKAGLPSVNLFYLLNNLLKDIPEEDIYFYTLGDYMIRILSGKAPYIHCTNAAATGLFDIVSNQWNEVIIDKLGMAGVHFPSIYHGEEPIEATIDNHRLLLYPAVGDQQAALLGSEMLNENTLSVNLGTGGQVSILSRTLKLSKNYQTRPYFYGFYLKTLPHIPSGRALNVYFNFIKEVVCHFFQAEDDVIWQYILSSAEQSRRNDMEIDMSFFTNPLTDNTQGSISSIQEGNFNVGNLFRSIYVQMAVNIGKAVSKLDIKEFDKIVFSGGVVKKTSLLRKFILEELKYKGKYDIAENETFKGLYRYLQLLEEKG